jgi:hypothetical protein
MTDIVHLSLWAISCIFFLVGNFYERLAAVATELHAVLFWSL